MYFVMNLMPVAIDTLKVPPYQRDLSLKLINDIGENWNPDFVNPLLVGVESQHIIDGNHTRVVMQRKGYTHAVAKFISCKSLDEEMTAFNAVNTIKKALTPYDKHRAWLSVGEILAIRVQEIMESIGIAHKRTAPFGIMRELVSSYPESVTIIKELYDLGYRINGTAYKSIVIRQHVKGDVKQVIRDLRLTDRNLYTYRIRQVMMLPRFEHHTVGNTERLRA